MSTNKYYSRDLSPSKVKTEVAKQAVQKPLMVYPLALSAIGLLYGVFFDFGLIAAMPLVAGGLISSASYVWDVLIKGGESANRYIEKYRKELEAQLSQMLSTLKKDLDDVGNNDGLKQVTLFENKYKVFKEVLNKKLEVGELTYNRYLTIAEQVFLGGLDNIENAALALKSVSAIDRKLINKQLDKLSDSPDDQRKRQELQQRLTLYKEQVERAEKLLLDNESALTQLDKVTSKIANINTKQQRAEIDLEQAMSELRHLISRTESYSNEKK